MYDEHTQTKSEYDALREITDKELAKPITDEIRSIEEGDNTKSSTDSSFLNKGNCFGIPIEIMFARDTAEVAIAKKVCENCVVIEECLELALRTRNNNGVWGGKSERERIKILKIRRKAQKASE